MARVSRNTVVNRAPKEKRQGTGALQDLAERGRTVPIQGQFRFTSEHRMLVRFGVTLAC